MMSFYIFALIEQASPATLATFSLAPPASSPSASSSSSSNSSPSDSESKPFTKDPISIAALDHSKFQSPSIKNHTNFQQAKRAPHPFLDKIAIHQNVFLEVKEAGSDLSIIPLEINFEFLAKGRLGPRYFYGEIQEFKTEFLSMKVNMKEC
jgi:hypothetical protein